MKYKHLLTQELGYQIYDFSKANWEQKEITHELDENKNTISRGLKRNR